MSNTQKIEDLYTEEVETICLKVAKEAYEMEWGNQSARTQCGIGECDTDNCLISDLAEKVFQKNIRVFQKKDHSKITEGDIKFEALSCEAEDDSEVYEIFDYIQEKADMQYTQEQGEMELEGEKEEPVNLEAVELDTPLKVIPTSRALKNFKNGCGCWFPHEETLVQHPTCIVEEILLEQEEDGVKSTSLVGICVEYRCGSSAYVSDLIGEEFFSFLECYKVGA